MAADTLLQFDPSDLYAMERIMEEYGNRDFPIEGTNENGEDVIMSVCHDSITVRTYQENGWIRKNIYSIIDGDITSEEIFDGGDKYKKIS